MKDNDLNIGNGHILFLKNWPILFVKDYLFGVCLL